MKTVVLGLVSAFLAATAHADPNEFAGHWVGKGSYNLKGDIEQCSDFQMVFSATPTEFVFESGSRHCDKHTEEFYRVPMTFANGNIYFGEEVVGTYSENRMDVSYRAPDGDTFRFWRMSMRREGENLMYEESRTMEGQQTPMISFAGVLIRQ